MRSTLSALLLLAPLAATQVPVVLGAAKDNTLYQDANGTLSNGAGQHLFAGSTVHASVRRALVAFDVVGSIPAGSRILGATLSLNLSRTIAFNPVAVTLHVVSADWGEGTSTAARGEGGGAPATPGDATWLHRHHPGTQWSSVGGDLVASPSAATQVFAPGGYSWTGTQVVADVQSWLDAPATNFGWMLLGDEALAGTALRFDSRQNLVAAARPRLTIVHAPPAAVVALGSACRGFAHSAVGLPQSGNRAFGLRIHQGTPSSLGILWLTSRLVPVPQVLPGGCLLQVDVAVTLATLVSPLDSTGAAVFGLPIPADPTLLGAILHSQGFSLDLGPPEDLLGANGLTLRIGS